MTEWYPRIGGRPGPRYLAIVEALQDGLTSGRLRAGDRLPTHRELARRLGLTVGTITRAYSEAERRGLVRGQVGRGTFISGSSDAGPAVAEPLAGTVLPAEIDLQACGALRGPFAERFRTEIATCATMHRDPSEGGRTAGHAATRWLRNTSGVRADTGQICFCTSARAAIFALLSVLASPRQPVAVEELTDRAVVRIFDALGLKLQTAIVDQDGLRPDSLELACWAGQASLMIVCPDIHQPLGVSMPPERRRQIVELARRLDLRIVEIATRAAYRAEDAKPLINLAPERTFQIFDVSDSLYPDLAVAGIVTPPGQAGQFAARISDLGVGAAPLMTELFRSWVEDGVADEIAVWQRRESARRRDIVDRALSGFIVSPTKGGGYQRWIRPAKTQSADAVVTRAHVQGLRVSDSRDFWMGQGKRPERMFVGLSGTEDRAVFAAAVDRLLEILNAPAGIPPAGDRA